MLSLGDLNVAISLVLAMFLESHVFRRCALERPWSVLGGLLGSVLGGQNIVISFGFRWFSVMLGFLMFFHRYLGAMSFSQKRRSLK